MNPVTALAAIAIAVLCATAQPAAAAEVRTGAGLCLGVRNSEMHTNGGRVEAWRCNGRQNQSWSYDPASSAVRFASGLCLDVTAGQMTTNGVRVQVWACNGEPQQQWMPLANGSLQNAGGFCLDVHSPNQNGAHVQIWQCNGSQQQRFAFGPGSGAPSVVGQPTAGGEIRAGAGLCVEVHRMQMGNNGARVQTWSCNGEPQQRWTYDSGTRAVKSGPFFCLDVTGGQIGTNGVHVQVWACNGQPQQQWTLLANGSLQNVGGRCLDVNAANQTRNGARAQIWPCNGSQQQRFAFGPGTGAPSLVGQGPVAPPPGVTPPSDEPVQANNVRQWRVENSDTVTASEPYELHNLRRRALHFSSQFGYVPGGKCKPGNYTVVCDLGWPGHSGGHFVFVRHNKNDRSPISDTEVVAIYNTLTKRYLVHGSGGGGVVVGFSSRETHEWILRQRKGADFALYNTSSGGYLVLFGQEEAGERVYFTVPPR